MTVRRSVILGCGSYLPSQILTNADLARKVDTSDEWIVQRTGIHERRIAAAGETTSQMATQAARAACTAICEVNSPGAAIRRSWMPVRCTIHSSDVSTLRARSALVRTWFGR